MLPRVHGIARLDRSTKSLIRRLKPSEIAVICHEDIDEVSAKALIERRVKAVVNARSSITGRYPNDGPLAVLRAGIPVLDKVGEAIFELVKEGDSIVIEGNRVLAGGRVVAEGRLLTEGELIAQIVRGRQNLESEFENFVLNTLDYAYRELGAISIDSQVAPQIDFRGRHALIVARGRDYKEDLRAIRPYIREVGPVLIGVDGGADALLEFGYRPDFIIGDMDSVSDEALLSGAGLIVHAYRDGRAPGLERLERLGLKGELLPAPGTSEDAAMLLAYERGAELIVVVGSHSSIIDFLDKGRGGMASTLLVRLKVGPLLVDAKGVNKLYRERLRPSYVAGLVLAALLAMTFVLVVFPPTRELAALLALKLKITLSL